MASDEIILATYETGLYQLRPINGMTNASKGNKMLPVPLL
jgi:hypothetical protein